MHFNESQVLIVRVLRSTVLVCRVRLYLLASFGSVKDHATITGMITPNNYFFADTKHAITTSPTSALPSRHAANGLGSRVAPIVPNFRHCMPPSVKSLIGAALVHLARAPPVCAACSSCAKPALRYRRLG